MMLYRLYTENTPEAPATVRRLLAEHGFDGATLQGGIGVWHGDTEKSLVVELLLEGDWQGPISLLAEAIRKELNQHAVLITVLPCESWQVTREESLQGREVVT